MQNSDRANKNGDFHKSIVPMEILNIKLYFVSFSYYCSPVTSYKVRKRIYFSF